MSLKEFKRVNIKDFQVSQLQQNVAEYVHQLRDNPRLSGLLVEDVVLTSGQTTTVNHGLGRKIRGFEVVYTNAQVDVWAIDANQLTPLRTLVLSTSANATISLWVF